MEFISFLISWTLEKEAEISSFFPCLSFPPYQLLLFACQTIKKKRKRSFKLRWKTDTLSILYQPMMYRWSYWLLPTRDFHVRSAEELMSFRINPLGGICNYPSPFPASKLKNWRVYCPPCCFQTCSLNPQLILLFSSCYNVAGHHDLPHASRFPSLLSSTVDSEFYLPVPIKAICSANDMLFFRHGV